MTITDQRAALEESIQHHETSPTGLQSSLNKLDDAIKEGRKDRVHMWLLGITAFLLFILDIVI